MKDLSKVYLPSQLSILACIVAQHIIALQNKPPLPVQAHYAIPELVQIPMHDCSPPACNTTGISSSMLVSSSFPFLSLLCLPRVVAVRKFLCLNLKGHEPLCAYCVKDQRNNDVVAQLILRWYEKHIYYIFILF
jgi:hypothetical protein